METVRLPVLADLMPGTKEKPSGTQDQNEQPDPRLGQISAAEHEMEEHRRQFEQDKARIEQELAAARADIEAAKKEASSIRQQAEADAESVRQQAKNEGYEEGIAESKEEYDRVLKREQSEFEKSVQSLTAAKHEMFEQMEPAVLDLACHIAEKIVKESLDRNDELFINIVKDTIKEVEDSEEMVLRLNKKDYDRFFAEGKNEYADLLRSSGVEIRQDMSVDSGECIVDTEYGTLRSGVQTQLERIRSALESSNG